MAEAFKFSSIMLSTQDKRVVKYLGENPSLVHAGQDVTLMITTDNISMLSLESRRTLLHHSMEEISFASGGDSVCTYIYHSVCTYLYHFVCTYLYYYYIIYIVY